MTPPALPPSRCPLSHKANLFLFLKGNLARKRVWVQGITEMELFKKCPANQYMSALSVLVYAALTSETAHACMVSALIPF